MSNKNDYSGVFFRRTIVEFNYMPEEKATFMSYFRRYKDLYKTDCANWSDHEKVRLVVRKLGAVEHEVRKLHITDKKNSDITF